ncbi:flavin reductase family protein [Brevibacterium sp.]|uniref:flavin reductase family protein n=1 Tax=Brevibacterium sp. TaxID=1701 RepID=UPI0025BA1A0C|nr:flavin reductase family protein [Brevibacterium sp.]
MAPILDPSARRHASPATEVAHTAEEYRRLAGLFPRPVAVLGTTRHGLRQAITVDSFLDVSYDPPTMAVSVYSGSRMAETLESAETCALSILTAEQKGIAQWLGEPGQPLRGLLDSVDTLDAPSGSPVISGCAAWFDLRIVQRLTAATHDLLVGEVTAMGPQSAPPVPPLVHWADDYHRPAPR